MRSREHLEREPLESESLRFVTFALDSHPLTDKAVVRLVEAGSAYNSQNTGEIVLSPPPSNLRPKEIQTRFLYPFFFDRDKAADASAALVKATVPRREGEPIGIWECCEPPSLYREELLDHVYSFLFANTARGCRYLRVSSPASSRWFNKLQAVLRKPKQATIHAAEHTEASEEPAAQKPIIWPVGLIPSTGIEIFLTNYGVGVLSISLRPEGVELDFDTAALFNYKLAQFRPKVCATLRARHASDNKQAWEHMSAEQKQRIGPPPSDDLPVGDRIGVAGGSFLLGELVPQVLLKPLCDLKLQPFQDQFSVYTVVRFGDEVDFDKAEIGKALAAFLSGISQIEEPGHAGSPVGVVGVTNAILNRRHSAAVGLLGMAQIVSDQSGQHSFNEQRVPRVMTKYFVPYLVPVLQRVSLQRSIREASDFVLNKRQETEAGFSKLRRHMLEFAVEGYFTEISHREVLDRYYRMVQEGLGVRRAHQDVARSIADIDAQFTADHQVEVAEAMADNVAATRKLQEETAKVQHKVSLLERFIVSVYAAELWHLVASHIDRLHGWLPYGVIAFAIFGFLGAWLLEKFWRRKTDH